MQKGFLCSYYNALSSGINWLYKIIYDKMKI